MNNKGSSSRMVLTRLEDRSLEAYKAWVKGILAGLIGEEEAAKREGLTEERWIESHKKFWAKADKAKAEREG